MTGDGRRSSSGFGLIPVVADLTCINDDPPRVRIMGGTASADRKHVAKTRRMAGGGAPSAGHSRFKAPDDRLTDVNCSIDPNQG
jgi:hypothetical protein